MVRRCGPPSWPRSAAIIGFDEVVMLGYRDSGMPDTEAEQPPGVVRPGRPRRGRRPAGRGASAGPGRR